MPSLSKRISLAWEELDPFEDTDTLVIVGHRYYVDVRITKAIDELDWVMAGVKEWLPSNQGQQKARFVSIMNSRSSSPGHDIPDEGIFTDLPNGDCLETGNMYDPVEGKIRPYKEVWRDILTGDTASGFILQMERKGLAQIGPSDNFLADAWIARMGNYQLAVGQSTSGQYGGWMVFPPDESDYQETRKRQAGDSNIVKIITPIRDDVDTREWKVDHVVTIDERNWVVKEMF
ncbi:hypothetical protein CPB86DRAFT_783224 [Serendipita vermifera]|nr:hypothetical protein CPB86DRAFT_783224 [Serendipita vermifera]